MIRSLYAASLIAGLASATLALPVLADTPVKEVRISILGRDTQTVRTEIQRAAEMLCRDGNFDRRLNADDRDACVAGAVDKALKSIKTPAVYGYEQARPNTVVSSR